MWKNVHPEYNAGIRTHNFQYMSLLPYELDQGSRPFLVLVTQEWMATTDNNA